MASEPMAVMADNPPFFLKTKDINKNDNKGKAMMYGLKRAAPSRASTVWEDAAKYVIVSTPKIVIYGFNFLVSEWRLHHGWHKSARACRERPSVLLFLPSPFTGAMA